jgi:hypothetical protein
MISLMTAFGVKGGDSRELIREQISLAYAIVTFVHQSLPWQIDYALQCVLLHRMQKLTMQTAPKLAGVNRSIEPKPMNFRPRMK